MEPTFVNELSAEFFGIQATNATAMFDSSSRAQMHTSHFSQRIVLNKHDEKILITGVEKKLAPYTFNIKMPENGRIFRIIHKYDPKGSINIRGKQHTNTIIIYQRESDGHYDYFEIPYFHSNHQIFGFRYVPNGKNIAKIQPNAYIEKDTIFADAPTVSEQGTYDYGVNTNVAFMSMKAVAEDGFIVSDRYMQRHAFRIQEKRSIGVGKDSFLVNLYGKSATDIQPLPGLGEFVRKDGLLAAMRTYNKELNPVEMSIFDMQEVNYTFDKSIYVRAGGGRVTDITVIRNNETLKFMPSEITGFLDKYADAYLEYNKKIYEAYLDIKKETKAKLGKDIAEIDPKLHALIVDAMTICNIDVHKVRQPLKLLYRKQPIDEYHIEVTIEHEIIPDIPGMKLTDLHGAHLYFLC